MVKGALPWSPGQVRTGPGFELTRWVILDHLPTTRPSVPLAPKQANEMIPKSLLALTALNTRSLSET